jgi:hypothetical protein
MTTWDADWLHRLVYLATLLSTILILAVASASAASLPAPPGSSGYAPASPAGSPGVVQGATATGPLLSYQGRLADPTTGNPKNGTFAMTFRLYDLASGGTALWTETKNVVVTNGLFSTLLGDTTALNLAAFDGRDLWLGVQVGSDLEATPRILVAYAPYALYTSNAARLGGQLPGAFAPAAHSHDATNIVSGILHTDRYHAIDDLSLEGFLANAAGDLALNNGVLQSTLNADLLDGRDSSNFAHAVHQHSAEDITQGSLSTDRFSAYTDLLAEGRIGMGRDAVAPGDHLHDERYVNVTGDSMDGPLTVPSVQYSAPRLQVYTVGSEAFVPWSNVAYQNAGGIGGAYLSGTFSGMMVAPVHLPQGARIERFRVFFYKNSVRDLTVELDIQGLAWGGYATIAQVTSAGVAGNGFRETTVIDQGYAIVDNENNSYLVYAWGNPWDGGNLTVKGAVVYYTITEAP